MTTIERQSGALRLTYEKLESSTRQVKHRLAKLAGKVDQLAARQADSMITGQLEQASATPSLAKRIGYAKQARQRVEDARRDGVKLDYGKALAEVQGVPAETLGSRLATADSDMDVRCTLARVARERVLTARAAGQKLEYAKALATVEQEAVESLDD